MAKEIKGEATPKTVIGTALAVSIGRAFQRGDLSQDAIDRLFEDVEDVTGELLESGELHETLPAFVGKLAEIFSSEEGEE